MFVLPMSLAAAVTIRVVIVWVRAQRWMRKPLRGPGYGGCLYGNPDGHIHGFTAGAIALLYNDNPEVVTLAAHLMFWRRYIRFLTQSRSLAVGFCGL